MTPAADAAIVHDVTVRGLRIRGHRLEVPLDPARPEAGAISVFAREVGPVDADGSAERPWLLFLQGGPGGTSPRPTEAGGWIEAALERGYRVLLLDQRGTGLSTPLEAAALEGMPPSEQARYLRAFRADAIVRDAEAFRAHLVGDEPWSVLGQSYGGFCVLTYLSFAPHGLREAFVTGGLSQPWRDAEAVYRACFAEVQRRNDAFFARYPAARAAVRRVAERLPVELPDGGRLTRRRLQSLGMAFGQIDGFETLAYLLERAVLGPGAGARPGALSDAFLAEVGDRTGFRRRPLYAVLHESIYAQGAATAWVAERVRGDFPAFDADAPDLQFTGEMIFPWMFEDVAELRALREAAERLAAFDDWPPLYDLGQLERNRVPVAAAVYHDDMYVPRALSLETAERIPRLRTWVTNEYEHDALRRSGAEVFGRLHAMVTGRA